MKFGIFKKFGALNSKPVFEAFEQGIKRKGWTSADENVNADIAVIWSVLWDGRMSQNQRIWEHFRKKNKPIIVLEVGALDRGNLWKVGLNGINGSGYFGPIGNNDNRRQKLNINLKSWKQGEKIIICGQHPKSQQWEGMPSIQDWLSYVVRSIREYTDREILIRPHPRAPITYNGFDSFVGTHYPNKITGTYDSFDFNKAINDAWAIVNWNSNPATVAALNGIPVFVGHTSYAAPVGNLFSMSIDKKIWSNIENPLMPDREQWTNDLAYTEWTLEELSKGEPLDRLSSKLIV